MKVSGPTRPVDDPDTRIGGRKGLRLRLYDLKNSKYPVYSEAMNGSSVLWDCSRPFSVRVPRCPDPPSTTPEACLNRTQGVTPGLRPPPPTPSRRHVYTTGQGGRLDPSRLLLSFPTPRTPVSVHHSVYKVPVGVGPESVSPPLTLTPHTSFLSGRR